MIKHFVFLFLILANLFWAGNYVFGKFVVAEMSPLQLTFSRWLLAIFLLFPLAHFIERPNWKEVWKEWKILFVLGLFGIIGYNFLLYEALQYTTSLNAALVNSINPALIFLFSALFLKEKVSVRNGFGLIISLVGVLIVITQGQLLQIFQIEYNIGDLIMLLAILVWTFYSLVGRKMKRIPPISATAVSVLFGLITLLPFVLFSGIQYPLSKEAMFGILYIVLFPSVGSFIFWNISLRHLDASKAGIYLYLITIFTAILSILFGETISAVQLLGGVLVFAGVYLTSSKGNAKNAATNTADVKG